METEFIIILFAMYACLIWALWYGLDTRRDRNPKVLNSERIVRLMSRRP